jgi:hypothetical protein
LHAHCRQQQRREAATAPCSPLAAREGVVALLTHSMCCVRPSLAVLAGH